jgi:hypothetical protein
MNELQRTASIMDQIENNENLLFVQFEMRVVDYG